MILAIDETRTAEIALDEAWRQLAPIIDRAQALKNEVAREPSRREDRQVDLFVRWLDTFQQELAAIQMIHDAAPRLTAEDLRAAHMTADKLLHAIGDAQSQLRDSAAVAEERAAADEESAAFVDPASGDT